MRLFSAHLTVAALLSGLSIQQLVKLTLLCFKQNKHSTLTVQLWFALLLLLGLTTVQLVWIDFTNSPYIPLPPSGFLPTVRIAFFIMQAIASIAAWYIIIGKLNSLSTRLEDRDSRRLIIPFYLCFGCSLIAGGLLIVMASQFTVANLAQINGWVKDWKLHWTFPMGKTFFAAGYGVGLLLSIISCYCLIYTCQKSALAQDSKLSVYLKGIMIALAGIPLLTFAVMGALQDHTFITQTCFFFPLWIASFQIVTFSEFHHSFVFTKQVAL